MTHSIGSIMNRKVLNIYEDFKFKKQLWSPWFIEKRVQRSKGELRVNVTERICTVHTVSSTEI